MTQTISKHIGEGFGRGELYAALAYDETDQFGGMCIKGLHIAKTTTGSGKYTLHTDTLTVGSDHTGQTVTALRVYTNMGSSAHTVGNFYGARIEVALKNTTDVVSGLMAGLQIIVDQGTCTSGYINGIDMVMQETGARAKAPNAFIALNDHDRNGSYPVAYLFDLGGLNSEFADGSGKVFFDGNAKGFGSTWVGTLKIKVNTADYYVPLLNAEYA